MERSRDSKRVAICSHEDVIPFSEEAPALVRDCETVLQLGGAFSSYSAFFGTSQQPLSHWKGIDTESSSEPSLRIRRISPGGLGLTGEIPAALGNLTGLEELVLGGNRLHGNIPPELGELKNLRKLLLQGNDLTGQIPEELGKLETLEYLYVQDNALDGCIPRSLANNPNLRVKADGLDEC